MPLEFVAMKRAIAEVESRTIARQFGTNNVLDTFRILVVSYEWEGFVFNEFLGIDIVVFSDLAIGRFMLQGEHGDYVFLNGGGGTVETSGNTNDLVVLCDGFVHKFLDAGDSAIIKGVNLVINS